MGVVTESHFHLLIRTSDVKLATFMRRLLTGYAVVFNLRHNRSGHLFQNRYKSIICQEDAYLLELVKYIHLNPIRAHTVTELERLDHYRWAGHAVIMGKQEMKGQDTDSILRLFGTAIAKRGENTKHSWSTKSRRGNEKSHVGKFTDLGQKSKENTLGSGKTFGHL